VGASVSASAFTQLDTAARAYVHFFLEDFFEGAARVGVRLSQFHPLTPSNQSSPELFLALG
jgi:hypothetical protein